MIRRHLSDDQIIEACLGEACPQETESHLHACAACAARLHALGDVLTESSASAAEAADAVFSTEWLARQRTRILQRVTIDGRPAKVLAFPGRTSATPPSRHPRPATRWLAAGVAAGLAVGLLTGHLVSRPRPNTEPSAPRLVASDTTGATLMRSIAAADDEFLGQLELAGASGGPESLRPLDALTPRAWDVR
jgi:anti-sigma factor RsiW